MTIDSCFTIPDELVNVDSWFHVISVVKSFGAHSGLLDWSGHNPGRIDLTEFLEFSAIRSPPGLTDGLLGTGHLWGPFWLDNFFLPRKGWRRFLRICESDLGFDGDGYFLSILRRCRRFDEFFLAIWWPPLSSILTESQTYYHGPGLSTGHFRSFPRSRVPPPVCSWRHNRYTFSCWSLDLDWFVYSRTETEFMYRYKLRAWVNVIQF